jgi:FtsH-binding integral membrane protein
VAEARRAIGWREVLLVSAIVVVATLGAAFGTSLLPEGVQRIVFHTPLLIVVLVGGTASMLWRVSRRPPDGPPEA